MLFRISLKIYVEYVMIIDWVVLVVKRNKKTYIHIYNISMHDVRFVSQESAKQLHAPFL